MAKEIVALVQVSTGDNAPERMELAVIGELTGAEIRLVVAGGTAVGIDARTGDIGDTPHVGITVSDDARTPMRIEMSLAGDAVTVSALMAATDRVVATVLACRQRHQRPQDVWAWFHDEGFTLAAALLKCAEASIKAGRRSAELA